MAFAAIAPYLFSALASMAGGLIAKSMSGGGGDSNDSAPAPTMLNAGGTANPQTSQQAEDKVRKQAALASGSGKAGTILTSPLGLLDNAASGKTSLLGQ